MMIIFKSLNKNKKFHSFNDQPAIIYLTGTKKWYKNDKLYRDNDQPAVIYSTGTKYWYNNDYLLTNCCRKKCKYNDLSLKFNSQSYYFCLDCWKKYFGNLKDEITELNSGVNKENIKKILKLY